MLPYEPHWRVKWCDIYRDGGSYGTVLEKDGRLFSLFLDVAPWDHPSQKNGYQNLWVSAGELRDAQGESCTKGSAEERCWYEILKQALTHECDDTTLQRLTEFIRELENRLFWLVLSDLPSLSQIETSREEAGERSGGPGSPNGRFPNG